MVSIRGEAFSTVSILLIVGREHLASSANSVWLIPNALRKARIATASRKGMGT